MRMGSMVDGKFYSAFECKVESEGVDILNRALKSAFWIRLHEKMFLFRIFFRNDCTHSALYEGRLAFRDILIGGIQLQANVDDSEEKPPRINTCLTIEARRPPFYTHRLDEVINRTEPIFDRIGTEADFMFPHQQEATAGTVRAVGDSRLKINPALWLTHQFHFSITERQYKLLWMCMVRLRQLDPQFSHPGRVLPMLMDNHRVPNLDHLYFDKRYAVESLLSHGIIHVPEINRLLLCLQRHGYPNEVLLMEGFFKYTRRYQTIEEDVRTVASLISEPRIPDHCILIRRCLVTPTRCLLNPVSIETSNSLLRTWKKFIDRFLRVQFVDDRGDFPITSETFAIDTHVMGQEGVFARIRRVLEYGICVAGRHYTFLCFGESQVKERGFWAISESLDGGFTVANVLASIGDLSGERVIAKHAARQGLALSATRSIEVDVIVEVIPDIEHEDCFGRKFNFTDGAGECSQGFLNHCARQFSIRDVPVSAVQCRSGGTKGILVVNQEIQDMRIIRLRPSMKKFPAENLQFSVLKVATYSRATLNRQAILLMESQGVPSDVLLDIFRQEKAFIENIEENYRENLERMSRISTFPLSVCISAGFHDDPFVKEALGVIRCRLLSDLRWKAWIEIPESAYLMGVPDTTGSLSEGEVFCQISPPLGPTTIVKGQCTIYRNPLLHPGDIRLVNAVDCPQLHHIHNVVVFSIKGERDLPNMDGDFYSLIWDPRLLIKHVHQPMNYASVKPRKSSSPVTIEDTKDHFVDFIMNDMLGRICNAHMALADKSSPADTDCVTLARLASQAVDFSKNGVPVDPQQIPFVVEYPDFMGKVSIRGIQVDQSFQQEGHSEL
ncbi:RNA dependent RNA polymerase-domain-containing protein [Abortiporus biennis]|nr:RNA dependent RNA polymerase-domain-containing protein [Abortiporus biennis]